MNPLLRILSTLPAADWLALVLFFGGWIGYATFAQRLANVRPSILATTNRWRQDWMLEARRRENRIVDAAVVQALSASPSFFASTTILIIGGALAMLSTTDKASELIQELPFAARTSLLVFDLKLVMLAAIFVYAFFRFTWSIRQYTFGAIVIGATPDAKSDVSDAERLHFAQRAGRVMGLAAESFNDGLRAYYFAFAAVGWFFSPWALIAGTVMVIVVLYRREFQSEVLAALNDQMG